MFEQEETVFDEEEWRNEAITVIKDVEDCVKEIVISENIKSTNYSIHCNLTTFEEEKYCVELTASGFRIVGKAYDICNLENEEYFETPYSLLSTISPQYREKFSSSLAAKLAKLSEIQREDSSTDNCE